MVRTRLMKRSLLLFTVLILTPSFIQAKEVAAWETQSNLTPLLETPLPQDPMKVTVHRLKNGLTIYLSPNDQRPEIVARIAVRAGGAEDPDETTGMAHYLEHMLFKGSHNLGTTDYAKEKVHLDKIEALYNTLFETQDPEKRKEIYAQIDTENQAASQYAIPNEIQRTYSQLGMTGVNAGTGYDLTVYEVTLPKNKLSTWARLEADRFAHPVFRLFQSEIEAVYEEKNRSMDNEWRVIDEALMRELYPEHPYGRTVIGSVEHLKNPSIKNMRDFFNRYYRPNNMAIILAGDFKREEVLPILQKYFEGWEAQTIPPRPQRASPLLQGTKRIAVPYQAEEMAQIAWRTVPVGHPDQAALTVMDMLVSNTQTGLIDLRLNQKQRVKWAGSGREFQNEQGSWRMYVYPKEGQTLRQAEGELVSVLGDLKNGKFTQADMDAIILNFEIGEKLLMESNKGRAERLVESYITYQDWPRRVDYMKQLRAVTRADVVRVARQYLGENRLVVYRQKGKSEIPSIEKPGFTKIDIEPGRQSDFFREIISMKASPIEPQWLEKDRDYAIHEVPSGKLYTVVNPANDIFALDFNFDRGFWHERYLCAALDVFDLAGANDMDADAFKRRLYQLGLSLTTYCGGQNSGVVLSGPEANLAEGLRLMKLRFAEPNWEAGVLEKRKAIWIGQHKDNKIDKNMIFGALADLVMRGSRSDTLRVLKDEEIKSFREDEIKELLNTYFDTEHRIAFTGTLPFEELMSKLGIDKKEYKKAPERERIAYVDPEQDRVVYVDNRMVQSKVGLFFPDELVDPSHKVDYLYYSEYLDGGMNSVIFQEIREARSLAYASGAGYYVGSYTGNQNYVKGGLGCQADKTVEASGLMAKLLRNPPLSQKRFDETKKSILESFMNSRTHFRSVAATVWDWEQLGLTEDPRPGRYKQAKKYKLTDFVRFSKPFAERPLVIYVLGDRDRINMDELKGLGQFSERKVDELFPY